MATVPTTFTVRVIEDQALPYMRGISASDMDWRIGLLRQWFPGVSIDVYVDPEVTELENRSQ